MTVAPRGLNAGPQRATVGPFAHDARPDADRLDQLPDVQEHDMPEAFAAGVEVVTMLFAVAVLHVRRREPRQVGGRQDVRGVIAIVDGAPQVRHEHNVEPIGLRHEPEIAIHLGNTQPAEMQMRVTVPKACLCRVIKSSNL